MSSWLTDRQKGEEEVIYVEVDHNNGKQAMLMEEDYLEFDDSAESAIEDLVDPSDGSNSEEEDAPESKITIPSAYEDIISPQQRFTTREGCQSPVRLPRSIAVAGQTFGSASTSRSMVTRSRSHAIDHLQALDDITTLAPLASLQSRILVELSRVSPLTYMRLSKTHFKEIIPTVYHTFHVTADFEKCLFGAHPMTETKCLGFLHVKHLFLGTDTGLCLHPFPEPFWNAKDFLLAIINLGKPERAKRWKYYWTTFPHQIITFKVAGPRLPLLDQLVLSELVPILLRPDVPQDWRKKHPHSELQIPLKKATVVLNNLVAKAYKRLAQIEQAERKRNKALTVRIDRQRYVIKKFASEYGSASKKARTDYGTKARNGDEKG
ncbi:hypothetical protein L804_03456 [Cryptococcus deuterogattii 2001/935-1]|nr:hypothetical protein L804_03456 [Cryptococcus deuterogattii 2001/935-1]